MNKNKNLMTAIMTILMMVMMTMTATATISDDITTYYSLDESSGTDILDLADNYNATSTADIVAGFNGNARSIYSNANRIMQTETDALDLNGNVTVNLWMKIDQQLSPASMFTIFSFQNDDTGIILSGVYSWWGSSAELVFNRGIACVGNNGANGNYPVDLIVGQWYMVTFKQMVSEGMVYKEIYLDGQLVFSDAGSAILTSGGCPNSGMPYPVEDYLYGADGVSGYPLMGAIDEIGRWKKELNTTEVAQIHDEELIFNGEEFVSTGTYEPSTFEVKQFKVKTTGKSTATMGLSAEYNIKNNVSTNILISWEQKNLVGAVTPITAYDYTYNNVPLNEKITTTVGTGSIPANTILQDGFSYRATITYGETTAYTWWKTVKMKDKAIAYAICNPNDLTGICRNDTPYVRYELSDSSGICGNGQAESDFMTAIQNNELCELGDKVQLAIQNMTSDKNCLSAYETLFKNAGCKLQGTIKVYTNNETAMKVSGIVGGEDADHEIIYTNPQQPISYSELGFETDDFGNKIMTTFFTVLPNEIAIDSENVPSANAPATLVWEEITSPPTGILKDGVLCSLEDCSDRTYNSVTDEYTFTVDGFSEFSLLFPYGDEANLSSSVIDTIVKTVAGFGAFALVLGIFIGGALLVYGANYIRKK
jgi:hypothetical protein